MRHKKTASIVKETKIPTWTSLLAESDRGCLLLTLALFDRFLQNLLGLTILCNLGKRDADFEKSLFNGQLRSLHSRIDTAYAFAVIEESEYLALHDLKDLRNEAAHRHFEFSFKDEGVAAHLKKLEGYGHETYRKRFLKEPGVEDVEQREKFEFVLRSYGLLMKLHGTAYREQFERYATEVRGLILPPLE